MAAITENEVRLAKTMDTTIEVDVLASTLILAGALVARDPSTGYATNAANTAGMYVIGVCKKTADNSSGASGDIRVKIDVRQVHRFATSGADQTHFMQKCWVVDNNTVSVTETSEAIVAGTIVLVESASWVWVEVFGPISATWAAESPASLTYNIPLESVRQADGAVMGITETAGNHYLSLGGSTLFLLYSEIANNETEASVSVFSFRLPSNYKAGGTVSISAKHQLFGAGTSGGSTIDFEVYKQNDGAAGSDLVTTTAATITTSWATSAFTITPTGLVAGDLFFVKMTTSVVETATADLQAAIEKLAVVYEGR